jgi:mono/diheme cytochrome c family protein
VADRPEANLKPAQAQLSFFTEELLRLQISLRLERYLAAYRRCRGIMARSCTMKMRILLLGCLIGVGAQAATLPDDVYLKEARQQNPSFTASAARGQAFFTARQGQHPEMPNCAACHGELPNRDGKHVGTGRRIKPLAPSANPARLSDAAATEKWFRRNCRDVLGRECSAVEKLDVIAFLRSIK